MRRAHPRRKFGILLELGKGSNVVSEEIPVSLVKEALVIEDVSLPRRVCPALELVHCSGPGPACLLIVRELEEAKLEVLENRYIEAHAVPDNPSPLTKARPTLDAGDMCHERIKPPAIEIAQVICEIDKAHGMLLHDEGAMWSTSSSTPMKRTSGQ